MSGNLQNHLADLVATLDVFVRRSETIFRGLPVRIVAREDGRIAVDRLIDGDALAVSGTGTLFSIAFIERMGAGCCAVE